MPRPCGWARLTEESRESRSLSAFLHEPFDPVSSLCQHVWATLGGRVGREDVISLLNALRVPSEDVRRAVEREFGATGATGSAAKRLDYPALHNFMQTISTDPALEETRARIHALYGELDAIAPAPLPSILFVMGLCALAPFAWPVFARNRSRLAGLLGEEAGLRTVVLVEAVFLVGYAPLLLLGAFPRELHADRVSTFECFAPALGLMLMCVLKAVSAGIGWFTLEPSQLHAWRRIETQRRFMQRFARNRILLQRLGVTVYGVRADSLRGVWAYELLHYLEHSYARPDGLADLGLAAGESQAGRDAASVGALIGEASPTVTLERQASAAATLEPKTSASARPEQQRRQQAARAREESARAAAPHAGTRGLAGDSVGAPPPRGAKGPAQTSTAPWVARASEQERAPEAHDSYPYYDQDAPDALDQVTHSLSIGSARLYSSGWLRARLAQPHAWAMAVLALVSPAIPCLVRSLVHGLSYVGTHPASVFVVCVNTAYGAPALLIVLLTMTHFTSMLAFRKALLRGLTASVRPDLASECGMQVALDLREPTNLTTWFAVHVFAQTLPVGGSRAVQLAAAAGARARPQAVRYVPVGVARLPRGRQAAGLHHLGTRHPERALSRVALALHLGLHLHRVRNQHRARGARRGARVRAG
jgi:hypothetical protein